MNNRELLELLDLSTFLKNLTNDLENNTLPEHKKQLIFELYSKCTFPEHNTHEDLLKYFSMGYYIYKIARQQEISESKNEIL
jgi:hypothetical protein